MNSQARTQRLSRGLRYTLAASTSIAALLSLPAMAQEAPVDEAEAPGSEIIVTGSLLRRSGMDTPQPVTAVSAGELQAMSPGNLVEGITQLPQFFNSLTPNAPVSWFTRGGNGNLDLRGIGPNRTLTLLNGRRIISSTIYGGVDITVFPKAWKRSPAARRPLTAPMRWPASPTSSSIPTLRACAPRSRAG